MRGRDNLRHEVLSVQGPGDWLIHMPVSLYARRRDATLPPWWTACLIEVKVAGKIRRFITSLCDPVRYPARALAHLYRQRWEIELGFREIKQSLQGSGYVLRSKQPALVRQEIWGVLIAYTLLRRQMRLMAECLDVAPARMGFHVASITIIDVLRFAPLESPATLPQRLAALFKQAKLFVLPTRRARACPRAVESRLTKYPKRCHSTLN